MCRSAVKYGRELGLVVVVALDWTMATAVWSAFVVVFVTDDGYRDDGYLVVVVLIYLVDEEPLCSRE